MLGRDGGGAIRQGQNRKAWRKMFLGRRGQGIKRGTHTTLAEVETEGPNSFSLVLLFCGCGVLRPSDSVQIIINSYCRNSISGISTNRT